MPLQPIRPTLILSEGAQPVNAPDSAGARPIPAVVIAVFFKNTLRDVIINNIVYDLYLKLADQKIPKDNKQGVI
jgi:hypothetical protein